MKKQLRKETVLTRVSTFLLRFSKKKIIHDSLIFWYVETAPDDVLSYNLITENNQVFIENS